MALLLTLPDNIYYQICDYLCIPDSLLKELKWACSKFKVRSFSMLQINYKLSLNFILNYNKIHKIRYDNKKDCFIYYGKLFNIYWFALKDIPQTTEKTTTIGKKGKSPYEKTMLGYGEVFPNLYNIAFSQGYSYYDNIVKCFEFINTIRDKSIKKILHSSDNNTALIDMENYYIRKITCT